MNRLNYEEIPNKKYIGEYGVNRPSPLYCNRNCMTVVLDLDETLIRTFDVGERIPISKNDPNYFSFYIGNDLYEGMKRPGLDDFIRKICKMTGNLVIFTASKPEYAKKIVDIIFKGCERKPDKIFTYDDCVKAKNGYLQKPIDYVFKHFENSVDEKKLIILDDKETVYNIKDIKNIAKIKAFKGDINDNRLRHAYYLFKKLWREQDITEKGILNYLA